MTTENRKNYPAHFRKGEDGTITEQSVGEHSENTARISSEILNRIGLASVGNLADGFTTWENAPRILKA